MSSPAARLRQAGLTPKKRFGQNFLLDEHACRRIAEALSPSAGGTALEIGPGLGALTRPLLERAGRVVALERDRDLAAVLREDLATEIEGGRLTLVEGDALEQDWGALLRDTPRPRGLGGNLPYLITGKLIEKATELARELDVVVVMVQAEVARRLAAKPSSSDYGALTVFVQAAFEVEKLLTLKGGAFYPRPEVDSSVVVLRPHATPRATEDDAFRKLVKSAFGARRKTLRNAWGAVFPSPSELAAASQRAGIDLDRRGETLDVESFERMARELRARGGG